MRRYLSISLFLMLLLPSQALADVVLIVRREAEAAGRYVRICDIARVEGPREQATEVGQTVLGPTPPQGRTLEITRWDIESRLYEMGIASRVIFTGNDMVKVLGQGARYGGGFASGSPAIRDLNPVYDPSAHLLRPGAGSGAAGESAIVSPTGLALKAERPERRELKRGTPIDGMPSEARDRVGKAIANYLAGRYKRPDVEVEAELLNVSAAIPYSAHEIEVDRVEEAHVPGKAVLKLRVRNDKDDPAALVTVEADTSVFALAPVAARQLNRGDLLNAVDVAIQRVKMESGKGYLQPQTKSVVGRQLARNLKKGEPILAVDAPQAQAVKQGDEIIHDTSGPGWRTTGKCKALGGGMVGDVIQAQDITTKKKFDARITAPGVVSIILKDKPTLGK